MTSKSVKFARTRCRVAGSFLFISILCASTGCDTNQRPASSPAATTTQNSTPEPTLQVPAKPRDAIIPTHTALDLLGREPRAADWFEDVTRQLGIHFAYKDGSESGCYQLLESVGGGIAAADFNHDGFQDLFFTGGGTLTRGKSLTISGLPGAMYFNQAGNTFTDVTLSAQVADSSLYTHGCTVSDLNADGFADLVVCGFGGLQVWLNAGDGTFTESAQSLGISSTGWNVSPAAADYNGDGLVDLYVMTYADWQPDLDRFCQNDQQLHDICGPTLFPGQRDRLFKNTGEGFVDVTDQVGLVAENRGLGIIAADVNANGEIDFLVVNDVQENLLYNNRDGVFEESGLLAGIAYSNSGEREGSMGIDVSDYNGDGLLDVWYANYAHQDNSLMKNLSNTGFVHSEGVTGLTGVSRNWVGFGTGFADFNCDGWDDIFVINGHVAYERLDSPYFQRPQLFKSIAGERFEEVSEIASPYFSVARSGRGAVRVDFNNDGALDLVVTHQNDPVVVLKNKHHSENWIQFDLVGVAGERSAVGSVATLKSTERTIRRWKYAGGSYLSCQDSRLLFQLNSAESVDILVTWLGGEAEEFTNLQPRLTHVIQQGRGNRVAQ